MRNQRRWTLSQNKNITLKNYTDTDSCVHSTEEWTKDNTVSFGLRDMIRRFRDCLGRQINAL